MALPPPGATPLPLEHFKFWTVNPIGVEDTVSLMGQFDKAEWKARVRSLDYLGNPVDKNDEGVRNEKLHLTGYSIEAEKQPTR